MADRVGVIRRGELVEVGDKAELMARMGHKTLKIALDPSLEALPETLAEWQPSLEDDGHTLTYAFDSHADTTGISGLMRALDGLGIGYKDLSTHQSSLEDIFVSLVHEAEPAT